MFHESVPRPLWVASLRLLVLGRLSCIMCPGAPVLVTCPGSLVLGFSCVACPGSFVLGRLSWATCPGLLVMGHLCWVTCPGSPLLGCLSWVACPDSLVVSWQHLGDFEGARAYMGRGGNTINGDTLVTSRVQEPTWAERGTRSIAKLLQFRGCKAPLRQGGEHDT